MTHAKDDAKSGTGKQSQTAPWLKLVQDFERAIGKPVEEFVRSDRYFDLVSDASKARAQLTALYERVSEDWLHLLNLPTNSDVRRLREQLSRLERQVNRLSKDLADEQGDDGLELPRKRGTSRARGSGTDAS